jgi:predicted house-cleaning NTP pyrophosphatase (Maf/HAM1 superfamily)
VTVDETVTIDGSKSYGMRFRRAADNASVYAAVNNIAGYTQSLTFTTPIAAANAPAVGDLFTFGEAGIETAPCVVAGYEALQDLAVKLYVVDEAPGVHTADSGTIPAFASRVSRPAAISPASIVERAVEQPVQAQELAAATSSTTPTQVAVLAPRYLGIGQLAAVGTAAFAGYTVSAPTFVGGEITVNATTTSVGTVTPNVGDWMVNYAGAVTTLGTYRWTGSAWTQAGITAEQRSAGMEDQHRLACLATPIVLQESATFDEIVAYQVTANYLKALKSLRVGGRYDKDGAVIDSGAFGFYFGASGCKSAGMEFEGEQGGGVQWGCPTQVGTGLTISSITAPALTALNGTDVAFVDAALESLRVYRWSGLAWAQAGSGLTISGMGVPAIASLNGTDIAFIDASLKSLRVYRWSGTSWAQVGSGLTLTNATSPALTALNATDVAFIEGGTQKRLYVYRWDGSSWSAVGSYLYIITALAPSITALNSTDIAYIDSNTNALRVYRWSGTSWAQVGSDLIISGSTTNIYNIYAINGSDIVVFDGVANTLSLYRWNGSTWSRISDAGTTNIVSLGLQSVTALNGTDVCFIDDDTNVLRTYRFSFSLSRPYSRKLTG